MLDGLGRVGACLVSRRPIRSRGCPDRRESISGSDQTGRGYRGDRTTGRHTPIRPGCPAARSRPGSRPDPSADPPAPPRRSFVTITSSTVGIHRPASKRRSNASCRCSRAWIAAAPAAGCRCRRPALASTQARSKSRGPARNFAARSSDRAATTRRRRISSAERATSGVIGAGCRAAGRNRFVDHVTGRYQIEPSSACAVTRPMGIAVFAPKE